MPRSAPPAPVYEFCGLRIASELALPELRRARGPVDCTITLDAQPAAEGVVHWFHAWRPRRGAAWLTFGRTAAGYLLRVRAFADFVIDRNVTAVVAHPAADLPVDTLRHLLVDQVLPLVVDGRGRPALHASAVHLGRRGTVAFVGESWRGKSTMAAALAARGGRIVTDDCLALGVRKDGADVLPGYPGLRLWPGATSKALLSLADGSRVAHYSWKRRAGRDAVAYSTRPGPLRAIFILSARGTTGEPASVRRMAGPARLMALLRSAYVLDVEDRARLTRLMADLSTVAATVPVFRLRVRHGTRHLAAAAAAIEEFAAGVAKVLPS